MKVWDDEPEDVLELPPGRIRKAVAYAFLTVLGAGLWALEKWRKR